MKTLLLLRHAKSSWDDPAREDHDRPLKKRGKRDAPRIGRLLAREGLVPDRILSSTAERARATAEAVAEACGFGGSLELSRVLYLAGPDDIVDVVRALPDDGGIVLVVGHNPGLEMLVEALTRRPETLPTAALARIALPIRSWSRLATRTRGELVDLWRPRKLRD